MSVLPPSYSVVFAGGGCRTFWSLGLFHSLRPQLSGAVYEWAGVSAGAAMALITACDVHREAVSRFVGLTAQNARNIYPERVIGGRRVFPHERIYRAAITGGLGDDALVALERAAPVRVFHAFVRPRYPVVRTIWQALRAHRRCRRANALHGPEAQQIAVGTETVTLQDARTPKEIADMIMRSSAAPPLTRSALIDGRRYVDAGLVDNAPVQALSASAQSRHVLVLLNRPTPRGAVFEHLGRLYLAPTRVVPITKWDYTSPERVEATFEMGRRDASLYRRAIQTYLTSDPWACAAEVA